MSEPLAGFELVLTYKRQSIANIDLQEKDPVRNGGVLFYLNSRAASSSTKPTYIKADFYLTPHNS